jgi:hypothetical protein
MFISFMSIHDTITVFYIGRHWAKPTHTSTGPRPTQGIDHLHRLQFN